MRVFAMHTYLKRQYLSIIFVIYKLTLTKYFIKPQTMSLETEMIVQINTIGKEKLIDHLKCCAKAVSTRDQIYFEELADHISTLYDDPSIIKQKSNRFKKMSKATLQVLSKYSKTLQCNMLTFTKNLIEYELNAVKHLNTAS